MAIHITTLNQLQAMKDNLSADYILDNDIDASATSGWNAGAGFEPVGGSPDVGGTAYTGIFDGQNHKIINLFINRPATVYIGLFAALGAGGEIKNVNIENCNINGDWDVGALVGKAAWNFISISNCHSSGIIVADHRAGGLIGYIYGGLVEDCYSSCNCSCTNQEAGGLIGWNESSLNRCHATGNISGTISIGGLVGENGGHTSTPILNNCYATGIVSADTALAGGLIGRNHSGEIDSCYATGNITSNLSDKVGGFCGQIDEGTISECYCTGKVIGDDNVGGFCGQIWNDGIISNCYSTGKVTGDSSVGGFCGRVWSNGTISKSYSTGKVTGNSNVGGFCGVNDNIISDCFWDTETSGMTTSDGGISKITGEMQIKSTFAYAEWDFDTVWSICEMPVFYATYPWLQWQNLFCTPYPSIPPPRYKLTIASQIIQCEADKQDLLECSFTLRKNGGCAEFSLSFGKPLQVSLGDEVRVYLFGSTYPWYRGRILELDLDGSSSKVRAYSGYGHFEQLSAGDLVDVEYGAGFAIDDLRDAVIDILDSDVRPYTSLISDDDSKIDDPSYTIVHVKFDKVKPIDALKNLCEMASGWELGVDENGDFYFRAESTTVTQKKWVGKHLGTYLPKRDMRKVINMIYLEGGTLSAGSNYDSVISDPTSIDRYGTRADKATIPSGMDTAEIQQWGNDLLNEKKDPIISARITGIDIERTQSRIWPRGLMEITSKDGEDSLELPIIAVVYHITPAGITADIELGIKRPSASDTIQEISRKVKQEQEQLASDVEQLASGAAIEDDAIHDFHIDWGTGADEVSAADIPIADGGGLITATDVEAALQEIFNEYQAGGVTRTLAGDLDMNNYLINNILGLDFKVATELTIAAGVITVTQSIHTVDTSGDDPTDDLDTINGGAVTQFIILRAENDARTIVVKHSTGNIWLKGKVDLSLDDLEDGLALFWDGAKWFDLGVDGGVSTWLALTDTPANFAGQIGSVPKVNDAENALEFDLARHLNTLCRNAAFASRSQGVTSEPDEWELEGTPGITYVVADLGYGDFAIRLVATAANEGIKQTLTHLKTSTKYQVWVYVNSAAGDFARLLTTGAAVNIDTEVDAAGTPTALTGEFTTDAATPPTDVVIKLLGKNNTDIVYFEGITCVEGDTPPGTFIRGFDGDLDAISAAQWDWLGGYEIDSMARAYKVGAQSNLPDGVWAKIELDAETYDPGNNFDPSAGNHKYTAPTSGYYLIATGLKFTNVIADKQYNASIYINGVSISISSVHSSIATDVGIVFTDIHYVNATETIELYGLVAGDATVDVKVGSGNTFMTICFLSN